MAKESIGPDDEADAPTGTAPSDPWKPRERQAMSFERGHAIGRFMVLGALGAGGMGEVYAAYDPELDRKVAVKVLRPKVSDTDKGASLLLREAQATAKLRHPNVVVIYDVGTVGESVFIAMELVEGETAKAWLRSRHPGWREVLEVFIPAGRGLAAAHAANLVHRDFKPDNVMITHDGEVRVMDFGVARQVGAREERPLTESLDGAAPAPYLEANLTRTGALVGTPAYMAPEQFLPDEAIDARTDQFNYCVALYEALYGERPFGRGDIGLLHRRAVAGEVQPPPAQSRVPPWVRRAVLRGLRPKREERWPSMGELLSALSDDPSVRRRRWLAGLAGGALVVATALGARMLGGARGPAQCSSGASRLAGAWEPAGASSPRKEAIHRAFLASGAPFAEQAFASVSRLLDGFAARWVSGYVDACEATHVRGEQSPEVLDLRMGCLGERLGNLRALTEVLAGADAKVVENAVNAAGALPSVERCSDAAALRAVVPPPQDPAARREVARVREDLARFVALRDAGQCEAASAKAGPLIAAADATGYDPLRAEVLVAAGILGDNCGDFALAIERLKAAYEAAYAGRDDRLALATAWLPMLLERAGRREEARDWLAIARAARKRLGAGGVIDAWVLLADQIVRQSDRDYEASIADARKAMEIEARVAGDDTPDVLRALTNLGNVLEDAGRYEEALATDRDALARSARLFGPTHPFSALVSSNMGEVLNSLGRHAEARAACQAALDIWQRAGADPSFQAYALTGLGRAALGEHRPAAAIAPLERALAIREERHAPPELLGETRFALARALWSREAERRRALALARAARAERVAAAAPVTDIDAWLRDVGDGTRD
ncbi:MAG TPA: serine/threonine-protein kinase [Polyangia bacterium]|nr:serine/threonine-protein kinase [Polyangia bacterium]